MKVLVALSTATCLLGSSLVYAQDVPTRETDRGSGILASAKEAALRVALQPNAAPQRMRRRGRLYGGLTLVGIGAAILVGGLLAAQPERVDDSYYTVDGYFIENYQHVSGTRQDVGAWAFFGGIGVAAVGGILIARADSTSRVRIGDGKPNEPLRSWRSHVVPLAGKASSESLQARPEK